MDWFSHLNDVYAKWAFKSATAARRAMWLKLATMMRNDVPVLDALEELQRRRIGLSGRNNPEAIAIGAWLSKMRNGAPLQVAIDGWVSAEEAMMVSAGEQGGDLPRSLESIAVVMNAKSAIQSTVLGGIAYPFLLICVAFGVLYLFGIKIIPEISSLSIAPEWKGQALMLVKLSKFIQSWYWVLFGAVVGVIVLFFASLNTLEGQIRVFLDRYPPYAIYRIMVGSSWLIALSASTSAGMRIEEALENLLKTATPWLKRRLKATLSGIRSGYDLGDALMRTGYQFPDREIINDIGTYARYRQFEVVLERLGAEWVVKAQEQIKSRMRVIFVVMLLVVGGLALFMASGVLDMQQQVSAAAQGLH
ncbi:MAG: type II secretion system F family protein [Oxalobacter sp.]|nr:type II secretion system F family protein [Oxalobacter sp.]